MLVSNIIIIIVLFYFFLGGISFFIHTIDALENKKILFAIFFLQL